VTEVASKPVYRVKKEPSGSFFVFVIGMARSMDSDRDRYRRKARFILFLVQQELGEIGGG
jgi:hypothetical protein